MEHQPLNTDERIRAVLNRYGNMVYRLAHIKTGNSMDADDVFQDVFLKLVTANPEFQSEDHLKAWLIRTTMHRAVNLWNSAWRKRTVPLNDQVRARPPEVSENSEIYEAVLALPERYRCVIHLFYYEEMKVAEISRALGVKPSAVRTRLVRARKMLGDRLKKEGGRCAEAGI